MLFSYSTSPLYPYYFGGDSAQFLLMGKAWLSGKIPYKDLFDHKGPIIYFIDMLGFAITGNKTGVSIIQVVFMGITLTAFFEISQLAKKSNLYGVIAVTVALIVMNYNYGDGNSSSEYCQPFLSWSVYGLLKYFQSDREEHDLRWTILYGMTAGVCLMNRLTDVIPICGGIGVVCIILLMKKHFRNFFQNAAAFILGVLIVILPFCVYFLWTHGAFEMFYDVLLFNVDYLKETTPWFLNADGGKIRDFLIKYFAYYCIFAIAFVNVLRKDYWMVLASFITCLAETYLFMRGWGFVQYAMICVVQVVLLLNEIVFLFEEKETERKVFAFLLLFGVGMALNQSVFNYFILAKDKYNEYSVHHKREWEDLLDGIPRESQDSFVVYGGNEVKELYLLKNIIPCYKYFVIQKFHSQFANTVKDDVYKTFNEGNARWILTDQTATDIQDILQRRYYVYDSTKKYTLYRLLSDEVSEKALKLREITDICEYLRQIHSMDGITVIFSVKDIQGYRLTEEMESLLSDLGFKGTKKLLEHEYHAFLGGISNGNLIFEIIGNDEEIKHSEIIGCYKVDTVSACLNHGNCSSIKINGKERSLNERGINIVVIDDKSGELLDTVAFDTHIKDCMCYR